MYSEVETLAQENLVIQYATLVKRIAHHLLGRLPASIQVDDLIQAGMIGLLEAAKNYDPTKGASFETYAGIRIRGTMLDEVRKGDWVPRSVHRNTRRIAEAVRKIEYETGRVAKDKEVAEELEVEMDEYHKMLLDSSGCRLFAYEDAGLSDDLVVEGLSSKIPGPYEGLKSEDFKKNLAGSIDSLPERERMILSLYYDRELNLKEIGHLLGVSESRVSQIHSQAMVRLKVRLQNWSAK